MATKTEISADSPATVGNLRALIGVIEAGQFVNSAQRRLIHELRISMGDLPAGACLDHGAQATRVDSGDEAVPDTFICAECGQPIEAP